MNKLLGIAVAVYLVSLGMAFHFYGNARYDAGKAAATAEIALTTQKSINDGKKDYEKNKIEVRGLDDDGLVRRYCRWVFDLPYDECIRTVKPLP